MADKPYRFLDFYTIEDADVFFGRERETRILLSDVLVNRLVVLFAKTGTGKTSLINAGVRPRLKDRDYATFFIRVRKDPAESARTELRKGHSLEEGSLASQLENVAKQLKQPIVLFFDQFEEFFIYVKAGSKKGRQFISDVAKVYHNQESGVHIVFSMREEFFVEMDAFRDEIPTVFHNESNLRLRWFDEGQARDAIVRPALKFGIEIETPLVDRLIADLSEEGMIEPAQLQVVCDTLWRKRAGGRITLAHYLQLGQEKNEINIAKQVLNQRLEEEFDEIEKEEQLKLLEKLLPKLRTDRNTKYVRDFDGLVKTLETDDSSLNELIKQLEGARLIRKSYRDDLEFIELSHDYLVERLDDLRDRVRVIWPRRLLKAAMSDYGAREELMTLEHLVKISENANNMTFDRAETEFLFRSALAHGLYIDVWFDQADSHGVGVWEILRDKIDKKDIVEAFYVINFLAELQTSDAFKLLEKALGQDELASYAIEGLGRIEKISAVELLAKMLRHDNLASRAHEALVRISKSRKEPDVASLAKRALTSFVEPIVWRKSPSPEPKIGTGLIPPYNVIYRGLRSGRVMPFLGLGASLGQVVGNVAWDKDTAPRLPTADELAYHLAKQAMFPEAEQRDLAKVAQYYDAVVAGRYALHHELHEIFARDYPLADIHVFLAEIEVPLLIVTTSYDDLIECAFRAREKPFDVLVHTAHREHADSVLWWPHNQEPRYVTHEFVDINLDTTTVIYKMHGSVDRQDEFRDSYVITEDDYIEFLTRVATKTVIPVVLAEPFQTRHFLFLGYGLGDWNLRGVLNTLERDWPRRRGIRSWAIQLHPSVLEQQFWQQRGVEIYDMSIQEFVRNLRERGR